VDAKRHGDSWIVYTHGGRQRTDIDVCRWVTFGEKMGAGEILLTSMDTDGTKNGYDIPLTKEVVSRVRIPVIASGGCGSMEDIYEVLAIGADAALAASVFHYREIDIMELKRYLASKGVEVRLKG
jgi:cyclase